MSFNFVRGIVGAMGTGASVGHMTVEFGPAGGTFAVGGKTYKASKTVSIKDGKLLVDGGEMRELPGEPKLHYAEGPIVVHGTVASIRTMSGSIEVHGNVTGGVSTMSGDVRVDGHVGGSATSMSGDVRVGKRTTGPTVVEVPEPAPVRRALPAPPPPSVGVKRAPARDDGDDGEEPAAKKPRLDLT